VARTRARQKPAGSVLAVKSSPLFVTHMPASPPRSPWGLVSFDTEFPWRMRDRGGCGLWTHHTGSYNQGSPFRFSTESRQLPETKFRLWTVDTPHWQLQPGFTFSFFYRIPPTPGNEISAEISPNFANSERKENSNSKNEISVNSDRNFGDFDRNFGDFDRKMMSVVIFVLFPRSNEKLLNTNFVQFFEIYNFCVRNFFI